MTMEKASHAAELGVSVVGLGKLGSPLAAALAMRGFPVVGADLDGEKVRALNEGRPPVYEPGLADALARADGRLRATEDVREAVLASRITFVVVPTPSGDDGGFSLRHVLPACEAIGAALAEKPEFHVVALTSTVMPGSTEGPVLETLERASAKTCGVDFGLCYSPEFIALGTVIPDLLNPDFCLIGESDERSGALLEALYVRACENTPAVVRTSFVNAELAKLAVNTFVTTKITFANMLSHICERLPGANVDEVSAALGHDSRIGPKYLKGAVGYGGPCFPRDNLALASLARGLGAPAGLVESTDRANREEVELLAELVRELLPDRGTVAVLGLAYKPGTDVVEESQGLLLAMRLAEDGVDVVAYDPAAGAALRGGAPPFALADSLEAAVHAGDVVVIATPWPEFRQLGASHLRRDDRRRVVVDCWRLLDPALLMGSCDYVPLGVGPVAQRAAGDAADVPVPQARNLQEATLT